MAVVIAYLCAVVVKNMFPKTYQAEQHVSTFSVFNIDNNPKCFLSSKSALYNYF